MDFFKKLAQQRKLHGTFNSRDAFSTMLYIFYVAEQADFKPKGELGVYMMPQNFRENLPHRGSSLPLSSAVSMTTRPMSGSVLQILSKAH